MTIKKWRAAVFALALVAIIAVTTWGLNTVGNQRTLDKAEGALKKGFGASAAEIVDGRRHALIATERGCQMLIDSYFQSKRFERLEWTAQACIEAGHEIPEAFLALVSIREAAGNDGEALRLLDQVAPRFDKLPDFYYRIAQILQRNKNVEGAASALMKAAERAEKNPAIILDAVRFLSELKKWSDARLLAEKLKDAPTEDPAVKLVLARAFKNGGDAGTSESLISQAKKMMDSMKSESRTQIERGYADVLLPAAAKKPAQ